METRFRTAVRTRDFDDLTKYLDRIREDTNNGLMDWLKTNPSTLVWDSPKGGRIQLKVLEKRVTLTSGETLVKRHHVMHVLSTPDETVQLLLDGKADPNLETKLAEVFTDAGDAATRRGLRFLARML